MRQPILEVKDLKTYFFVDDGVVKAVDGVNFEIYEGETLGIVGESGCGKSVTSISIMRLVPNPPGKIVGGQILFKGKDLVQKSEEEMRKIRGNEISMIFQEPMTSLNPVYTVGDQIAEAVILHQKVSKKEAMERAVEMLRKVGIPAPEKRVYEYPHQLSGGMRQRVMIAMALSCNPSLLIADEPTTALDVTIQAQILELMKQLRDEFNTAIMLITHDLGVVAEVCDRVAVMYSGKVVEYTDVKRIFLSPRHPYTIGLLNSIPKLNGGKKRLEPIKGVVPNPLNLPKGCKFNNRCPYAKDLCFEKEPEIKEIDTGHFVRCWFYDQIGGLGGEADEKIT
ncbi:peptide ABC transporter ATP-binding protein [Anoxybacter fermentans]|uniref:Peptide ABC transporter ATP-binding protein n=1 Tax=Anoxybacter fermentans TaxID=1323375 RepID=A0A3Q9HR55_9FIRM|nr:ABC transporter ATP-binding protein [Anoxybacter fermentans]AZR73712.1 peptide ABC transporter ATP-binding protein [Anoxybacter fermentans]